MLAGGSPHAHDFAATGAALAALVTRAGHRVEVVAHPDDAAARVDGAGAVDALVVNALWWRMLGDVYEPWRDGFGYSPPVATRDALAGFVHGGGGLVAMHTAPICFDDWPGWGDIVGGAWRWGVSSHPARGPVTARFVAAHPVVAGLPGELRLLDEVYGDLAVSDDVNVLAVASRDPSDADQPVVWTRQYGAGRVVFDGFGHDARSIGEPTHARLITQALAWVLEEH